MRTATDGKYPRFAVWENVPGAYSSNKGEDFRAVLEEIAEAEIPMPRSGKWATAGMVRTERVDIAWRTIDAQYWGVPQRRKRIFLVADFRGQCAGEILFVEPRLSGHPAESGSEGQEAAGDVGTSVTEPNCLTPWDVQSKRIHDENGIWPTLYSHQGGSGAHGYVAQSSRINSTPEGISGAVSSKWAKGTEGPAGDECYNLIIEPQLYDMTHADEVMRPVEKGVAPTLNSRMGTGGNQVPVMLCLADQGGSQIDVLDDISPCLRAQEHGHQPCVCLQGSMIGRADKNGPQGDGINEEVSFTLNATHPVRIGYAVRRLTPTECLRLQGFPDYWLDIEGMSDTAKYKAVGNSVAIPCVDFVMAGIARVKGGVL